MSIIMSLLIIILLYAMDGRDESLELAPTQLNGGRLYISILHILPTRCYRCTVWQH